MKLGIGLPNTLAHEVDRKLGELQESDVVVRDLARPGQAGVLEQSLEVGRRVALPG